MKVTEKRIERFIEKVFAEKRVLINKSTRASAQNQLKQPGATAVKCRIFAATYMFFTIPKSIAYRALK